MQDCPNFQQPWNEMTLGMELAAQTAQLNARANTNNGQNSMGPGRRVAAPGAEKKEKETNYNNYYN